MLLHIGFNNYVNADRIVAVIGRTPNGNISAPMSRYLQNMRKASLVIDATAGRKTNAIIFTDSGHVILSNRIPETIKERVNHE